MEELTIVGPTDTGLASLVLDELAEAKETHFPKLKHVQMSQIENPSRTKVSAENGGIILELDDEEDDDEEDNEEEDEDNEEEDEDDEKEDEDEEEENDDDDVDDAEGNEEIVPMEESE